MTDEHALRAFAARSIARPVHPAVRTMADHLWSQYPGAVAVIAYGSCLRGENPADTLIDFYLLTADLRGVSGNFLARLGCRLLPPNVFFAELAPYRAKCAVMPAGEFLRRMRPDVAEPYFWARFAQPVALLRGDAELVAGAVADALKTMYGHGRGLGAEGAAAFAAGFAETYRTELRSERRGRAASLVASNTPFYSEAARLLAGVHPIAANWRRLRVAGKLRSVARLAKAAFTFAGGADYIAWKIERHSGEKVVLSPWQRRHPVLAGALLLPRLLRSGAVR